MNILAVDDEALALHELNAAIREALPNETPACFRKAVEALAYARDNLIDVAFLDVNMGGDMNGLHLAEELDAIYPATNIIFVTGYSDYLEDAFRLYASGYVKKPVLAKRILREISHLRHPLKHKQPPDTVRELGPYVFDHTAQRVYCNGQDTNLSPREFKLFHLFAGNPGVTFTAEDLFKQVWGDEPVGSIVTVKVHVSSLRKKLGMYHNITIQSQKGTGYTLSIE